MKCHDSDASQWSRGFMAILIIIELLRFLNMSSMRAERRVRCASCARITDFHSSISSQNGVYSSYGGTGAKIVTIQARQV